MHTAACVMYGNSPTSLVFVMEAMVDETYLMPDKTATQQASL